MLHDNPRTLGDLMAEIVVDYIRALTADSEMVSHLLDGRLTVVSACP